MCVCVCVCMYAFTNTGPVIGMLQTVQYTRAQKYLGHSSANDFLFLFNFAVQFSISGAIQFSAELKQALYVYIIPYIEIARCSANVPRLWLYAMYVHTVLYIHLYYIFILCPCICVYALFLLSIWQHVSHTRTHFHNSQLKNQITFTANAMINILCVFNIRIRSIHMHKSFACVRNTISNTVV